MPIHSRSLNARKRGRLPEPPHAVGLSARRPRDARCLLENWIDEAERRTWFLFEATRTAGAY